MNRVLMILLLLVLALSPPHPAEKEEPPPRERSRQVSILHADRGERAARRRNAQNPIFGSSHFRGQLLVPYFKYAFNSHMFARVMPEFFFPGNFYKDACNDVGTFVRVEFVFTW